MEKGVYKSFIEETLKLFGYPDEQFNQKKNGRNFVAHPGPHPPMFTIESYLVDAFTSFAATTQPDTPSIALELINSMIQGTVS